MNIMALFNALPGACAQGLIWGIMAIGVYITYKILDVADLTVDGTMCTGGAVCVMMMLNGYSIWISLLCAFIAGMLAGLITGIFHTFMGIPAILAGILTQLALYSINLRILGSANQAISVRKYNLLISLMYIQRAIWISAVFVVAVGIVVPDIHALGRREHGHTDCAAFRAYALGFLQVLLKEVIAVACTQYGHALGVSLTRFSAQVYCLIQRYKAFLEVRRRGLHHADKFIAVVVLPAHEAILRSHREIAPADNPIGVSA